MKQSIAAFRFITSCLSENASPEKVSELQSRINSGHIPWESVISLANDHLLTPALWVALNKKKLTEDLPEDLRDYLYELHRLSKERNAHLQKQLLEVVQQLNSISVTPILLKGALHLISDIYSDPGVRIMTDIDLLVPKEDVDKSLASLHELGYRHDKATESVYSSHHHCDPLFRPGDYGAVEIHQDLINKRFSELLPAEEAIAEARPLKFKQLSMKTLSSTHRILHNIVHSQLVDRIYQDGLFPLRSMYEVVTESNANRDDVNWLMIQKRMGQYGRSNLYHAYLYMTHRLYDMPLPAGVRAELGCKFYNMRCHAQLRWPSVDTWARRLAGFSADNMNRLYSCKGDWLSLNRARLQYAKRKIYNFTNSVK